IPAERISCHSLQLIAASLELLADLQGNPDRTLTLLEPDLEGLRRVEFPCDADADLRSFGQFQLDDRTAAAHRGFPPTTEAHLGRCQPERRDHGRIVHEPR